VAEAESVRVELAFEGGQIIAANVPIESADALERAITASSQGTFQLDTDDGRISVALPRVVYVKRYAREARVGFGI
jgi:hypothetical protein